MAPTMIDSGALQLPEDVQLWQYAEDFLVLAGPSMTRERFHEIKSNLPEELRTHTHGWRRIGR